MEKFIGAACRWRRDRSQERMVSCSMATDAYTWSCVHGRGEAVFACFQIWNKWQNAAIRAQGKESSVKAGNVREGFKKEKRLGLGQTVILYLFWSRTPPSLTSVTASACTASPDEARRMFLMHQCDPVPSNPSMTPTVFKIKAGIFRGDPSNPHHLAPALT